MKLQPSLTRICLLIMIMAGSLRLDAQNIDVTVTGIRETQGQLLIRIFKDSESFKAETPFVTKYIKKSGITNGTMTFQLTMDPGTYGYALVDDENSNNEMDFNFIGYPEEGFGFSNYYHSGLSTPSFDAFKFTVVKNQKQKINIKIRYM